jgi:hypothetical protein
MKVALLLKGSSIASYDHWQYKDRIEIDYKHNIDNLNQNLIKDNNCDVFFHTWKSENIDINCYKEMASDLNAVSWSVDNDISGEHGPALGKKIVTTTKKVIDCYNKYKEENQIDYDLVIICRFDLFFLQKINLSKILETWENPSNSIWVYALGPNVDNLYIDKNTTKDQGIDDNFIVFSPDTVDIYNTTLDLKKETVATYRSDEFFNPTQHCSLHHLYYLLPKSVDVINLTHVLAETEKKSIHGTIKKISPNSLLMKGCPIDRLTRLDHDLFVIHYE